jgi:CPA2 family monovalent cation:H+ antiporter-2
VVACVVILKVVITGMAARLLRYPAPTVAATAFLLAQIGEFSFVLERVGRSAGLYPAGVEDRGGHTFIAVTVLLMAVTPLLAKAGRALEERRAASTGGAATPELEQVTLENHVIVAGYGSAARYLTRVLRDSGVPFVIVTLSPSGAGEAQVEGLDVIIGDYSKRFLLMAAAIDNARMLVIPDDTADMARRVVGVARGINPTLHIVVRTQSQSEVDALIADGADEVLVDELEIGVQLFTRVLDAYQINPAEIEDHVERVRNGAYAALRAPVRTITLTEEQRAGCEHAKTVRTEITTTAAGCEDCLRIGESNWVHLRLCMTCGGVRCCDSSPYKHATAHHHASAHPIIRSYQAGELWAWCYVDERTL